MEAKPNLIAIIGPTASGKTSLALSLAQRWGGEIICADSRTIYKGMDIGTAKPTLDEQSRVPHWGLDLVEPNERFTAADFQIYANKKIADINARGKVAVLVGGTGLYINSVLYNYAFPTPMTDKERMEFESMTVEALYEYCVKNNIELPINDKNKRHLVQKAVRGSDHKQIQTTLRTHAMIVGIATKQSILHERIRERSEYMFDNGVVEEATMLGKKYGWESGAMTGNVYRLFERQHGLAMNKQDFISENTSVDVQLAKRQMTWFRRNPDIMWCSNDTALAYVDSLFTTD